QTENTKPDEGGSTKSVVDKSQKKDATVSEWNSSKADEEEKTNKQEEEEEEEEGATNNRITPSLSSSTTSSYEFDRQDSVDHSSQNHSSTTSESFATQVHRPDASTMVLERADTVPSDSTPLSSSSTPPSSPKPDVNVVSRSVVVDPPSAFADTPSPQKDIYFPYLSKVRNLDQEGCGQETLYQPLRFDKPTRDPFTLPSRSHDLSVSVEHPSNSFSFTSSKSNTADHPLWPNKEVVKTPLGIDKTSLLLRHGYTPHRDYELDGLKTQLNVEVGMKTTNEVEPRPTVVRAGCAPPVEEPIIVAEFYVPLCDVSAKHLGHPLV
ncbi:unnamed protein product, partial [Hydatigera taeniaeformis]|uniref:SH2 domain-containing protein n=1 Tax=Hydatigena taeniaeformis TaxID=6205 RepID=A0A0R3WVL9_HYDTA